MSIADNTTALEELLEIANNLSDAEGGADPVIEALSVTENGTYTAPDGVDGYSPVTVNVPVPDGYIQPSGTLAINENGEHDVTEYASVDVDVPIPDGYIVPSGELEVTENGTHDVTEYASVNVNVAAEGDTTNEDGFLTNTLTEYSNSRITELAGYALYRRTKIVSLDFPNLKKTGTDAFFGLTSLKTINVPNLTYCSNSTWYGCSAMTAIELPLVTYIGVNGFYICKSLATVDCPLLTSAGQSVFQGCSKLTSVNLPLLASVPIRAFRDCAILPLLDSPVATSVGTEAFYNCYSLTAVILRSTTMATLAGTNAFTNAYHFLGTTNATYNPDGLTDGYIYVPADLVESYQAATNWATYADRFRALEDYTVDGTITGELDETKI